MADGHGNWDDLYSIVRSCAPHNTNHNTNQVITQTNPLDNILLANSLCFEDELQDSYKPFLPSNYYINPDKNISSTDQSIPSTSTYNSGFRGQPPPLIHQQAQLMPLPATSNNIDLGPPLRSVNNMGIQHQPAQVGHQVPRSRKKSRSQQRKRVVELPADDLSTDMWAWRKYGQKPIKGSPFPRSYYKCSSSRGCPAKKQVERTTDNPDLFIVSFSGDHTHPPPSHRNTLAGTSRLKLSSSAADATSADSQSLNQKDLNQMVDI